MQSLRMRSTQGSSSNMMEWLIPLKNSRTNFPITRTTEAYSPMMLGAMETGAGTEEEDGEHRRQGGVCRVVCEGWWCVCWVVVCVGWCVRVVVCVGDVKGVVCAGWWCVREVCKGSV